MLVMPVEPELDASTITRRLGFFKMPRGYIFLCASTHYLSGLLHYCAFTILVKHVRLGHSFGKVGKVENAISLYILLLYFCIYNFPFFPIVIQHNPTRKLLPDPNMLILVLNHLSSFLSSLLGHNLYQQSSHNCPPPSTYHRRTSSGVFMSYSVSFPQRTHISFMHQQASSTS